MGERDGIGGLECPRNADGMLDLSSRAQADSHETPHS